MFIQKTQLQQILVTIYPSNNTSLNLSYLSNDITSYILSTCTTSSSCPSGYIYVGAKSSQSSTPCVCLSESIFTDYINNQGDTGGDGKGKDGSGFTLPTGGLPSLPSSEPNTTMLIVLAILGLFLIVGIGLVIFFVVRSKKNK